MGWHDERFIETKDKLKSECVNCGVSMWFPPSKAGKYLCCGKECSDARREKIAQARAKCCETCGKTFSPRPGQLAMGHGRYCSQKCNTAGRIAMNSEDAQKRAQASFKEALATGRYVPLTGPENPSWKGGYEASKARLKASGKLNEFTKRYRKKNPEKVREFTLRRKSRKYGRLPRGTVAKIGQYQKWKCAICKTDIAKNFHVDHIMPLAKGGMHEPTNIQLLCPTCNVRKSAKHPVDYMQELGFLL